MKAATILVFFLCIVQCCAAVHETHSSAKSITLLKRRITKDRTRSLRKRSNTLLDTQLTINVEPERHHLQKRSKASKFFKNLGKKLKATFKKVGKTLKKIGKKILAGLKKYGLMIASQFVKYMFKIVGKLIPIPGFSFIMNYVGNLASAVVRYAASGAKAIKAAITKAAAFGFTPGQKLDGKSVGKTIASSLF